MLKQWVSVLQPRCWKRKDPRVSTAREPRPLPAPAAAVVWPARASGSMGAL